MSPLRGFVRTRCEDFFFRLLNVYFHILSTRIVSFRSGIHLWGTCGHTRTDLLFAEESRLFITHIVRICMHALRRDAKHRIACRESPWNCAPFVFRPAGLMVNVFVCFDTGSYETLARLCQHSLRGLFLCSLFAKARPKAFSTAAKLSKRY